MVACRALGIEARGVQEFGYSAGQCCGEAIISAIKEKMTMRLIRIILAAVLAITPAASFAQSGSTPWIASDSTVSGSIAATSSFVTIPTNGRASVGLSVTGTWSGALTIQVSVDYSAVGAASATWGTSTVISLATGTVVTGVTADGIYQINAAGFSAVRVFGTNIVSGTANIAMVASAGTSTVMADNPFPVTWTTDPCSTATKSSAAINVSSATTTSLVAVSGTTTVYVCGFAMTIAPSATTADTALFEYGTGAACTSPVALTGTFGNGDLTTTTGVATVKYGAGGATIFKSASSNGICILTAGNTVNVQGVLTYVQQ